MLLSFPTRHCVAKNHASRWCTFRLPNGALSECRVHPVLRSAAGIRRASPRGLGRHGGRQRLRYGGVRPSTPSAPGRSSRRRDSLLPGARRAPPDRCAGGLSERVRGGPRPVRTAPSRAAARPPAVAPFASSGRDGTAPTSHNGAHYASVRSARTRPSHVGACGRTAALEQNAFCSLGAGRPGLPRGGAGNAQAEHRRLAPLRLGPQGPGALVAPPAALHGNGSSQTRVASSRSCGRNPGSPAAFPVLRPPSRSLRAPPSAAAPVWPPSSGGTPRAHVRRPSRGHAGCGALG